MSHAFSVLIIGKNVVCLHNKSYRNFNKPSRHVFQTTTSKRICLCVHFPSTLETLFSGLGWNALQPKHPAFIPPKDIYDDLLQDFLRKCWQHETKSLHCPWAINKPELCESFALQRWGKKPPWSIIIILSLDAIISTQVHYETKWNRKYLVLLINELQQRGP